MYKIIKKIHLWLAVPFGIVMMIICATGLILLFEPDHASGAPRSEFFLSVMRLHRWLFDAPAVKGGMTAGKMVIAITVCAMILVIVTGLIMWVMRARHNAKAALRITAQTPRGFWTSLHVAGGFYVSIILLVMALTGLTWSFGGYREVVNAMFDIAKGSHAIYGVHTGAFGGIVTKSLWFVAALVGFLLPPTGYYMWIKRISARR